MTHRRLLSVSLLTAFLASGCQAPVQLHQLQQPRFALGGSEDRIAVNTANEVARSKGELTVQFQGELARWEGRKVLATAADVDHVTVIVKAADGSEFSKTADKAAITNGVTSLTFQGLAPGAATVTITAFDANGKSIGTATKAATVTAGQTATVDVAVNLAPTYVPTGGSGSTPSTGGLTTNVSINDGLTVNAAKAGDVIATHDLGFETFHVAVDSHGRPWVSGKTPGATPGTTVGKLVRLNLDGTVAQTWTKGVELGAMAINGHDHLWVVENYDANVAVLELDADGNELHRYPAPNPGPGFYSSVDDSGNFLFGQASGMFYNRVSPTGQFGVFGDPSTAGTASLGAQQDIWSVGSADPMGGELVLIHQTLAGTRLGTTSLGDGFVGHFTAIAPDGSVWLSARHTTLPQNRLYHVSAQGQKLGYCVLPDGQPVLGLRVASDGVVWAQTPVTVHRFSSAGVALTSTALLCDSVKTMMAVGRSGAWVLKGDGSNSLTHLAP